MYLAPSTNKNIQNGLVILTYNYAFICLSSIHTSGESRLLENVLLLISIASICSLVILLYSCTYNSNRQTLAILQPPYSLCFGPQINSQTHCNNPLQEPKTTSCAHYGTDTHTSDKLKLNSMHLCNIKLFLALSMGSQVLLVFVLGFGLFLRAKLFCRF